MKPDSLSTIARLSCERYDDSYESDHNAFAPAQANGTAFDTPEALLERMGLLALTQQRFSTFLTETLGSDVGSQRYGAELVGAVNRVNYNQGNSLNALVGANLLMAPPVRVDVLTQLSMVSTKTSLAHC